MKYRYEKPIEMQRGTHYGSNYWEVYSKKVNRIVKFFSNLEYENFLSLEVNADVEYFCEQPVEVKVFIDGDNKKTVFDMWVKYKDGREEYQEVKYESELIGDNEKAVRTQKQIEAQKKWCTENGQTHVIRTENEIHTGIFKVRNLKYIAGKIRRYNCVDYNYFKQHLINYLLEKGKVAIQDIINLNILPKGKEIEYICIMFYFGIILLDIEDKPICKDTGVSLWH